MIGRGAFVVFCSLAISPAFAAKLDACPTLANGTWVIASIRSAAEVTALSDREARAYIGKKVSVSAEQIDFAGRRCKVLKQKVYYSAGDDFDIAGFPYWILYDCADEKVNIPALNIGRSCDHILVRLEGFDFNLRRAK